jgi:cell division septum initiation protein DivIVA
MGTSEAEMWSFSRRFLGYDTHEVSDYLTRFTQYAEALERRAVTAEQDLEERTRQLADAHRRLGEENGEEVGGRIAEMLGLAEQEAREIRERAHTEERTSAERATLTADRILVETAEERRLLERQVAEITATRANLLGDLRSLSAQMVHAADQYDTPVAHAPVREVFDAEASTAEPSSEPAPADDDTRGLADADDRTRQETRNGAG